MPIHVYVQIYEMVSFRLGGGGGQDVSKDFINESMNSMMGRVG